MKYLREQKKSMHKKKFKDNRCVNIKVSTCDDVRKQRN